MKCLLAVDVQYGFINEHTREIPTKVRKLIETGIFDYCAGTQFYNRVPSPFTEQLNWHSMQSDSEIAIVSQLQGCFDVLFRKRGYSSISREFLRWLPLGSEIYICGVDTDACVYTTAIDCFSRNLNFKVIEDCCASSGGLDFHNAAIKLLRRNVGDKNIVQAISLVGKDV